MENLKWLLFGVLLSICASEGYKLLLVFPLPSKSHGILGDSMVKHLLNAGHEVTYITPFVKRDAHPKLHLVDVSDNMNLFNENSMNVKVILDKLVDFQDKDLLFDMLYGIAKQTLEMPTIQKFMRDPKQKFDVVIGEWMFNDIYAAFAAVFDCPFIWFSTMEPHSIILNQLDGPVNPAYLSDYLSRYVHPLSFTERIQELWELTNRLRKKNFNYFYQEEEIYQSSVAPVFKEKGRPVPSYAEVINNVSLVLGNSQVTIGDAISLPQSYKHIGGYHIDDEVKPLPEDLKKIMDNAKNGVIYFSMGSNIKSKDLPVELKRGILNVFGDLKQTVIWKFEEILPDIPKNVHIVQWAPQQSILAHPNTVLFMTHGGLLSITESHHFGVPIITIPVFGDQFINAKRAERKGYGKEVDLSYTMHEDIKVALKEVLNNPKYSEKAKALSKAYHDHPMRPKDELVYWVSHVIRTGGAQHLRSPALELPLYQRLYLDLVAVLLVLYLIIKAILRRLLCMFSVKLWSKKEKRM